MIWKTDHSDTHDGIGARSFVLNQICRFVLFVKLATIVKYFKFAKMNIDTYFLKALNFTLQNIDTSYVYM